MSQNKLFVSQVFVTLPGNWHSRRTVLEIKKLTKILLARKKWHSKVNEVQSHPLYSKELSYRDVPFVFLGNRCLSSYSRLDCNKPTASWKCPKLKMHLLHLINQTLLLSSTGQWGSCGSLSLPSTVSERGTSDLHLHERSNKTSPL